MRYETKRFALEKGPCSVDIYPAETVPSELMDRFFDWKRRRYPDSYRQCSAEEFLFRDRRPVSHAYALRAGGEPTAVLFTAEQCEIAYLVNTAYDPETAKYSAGRLLYYELLRRLIQKQTPAIYLGTGKYDYKRSFGAVAQDYWVGDFFR